MGQCIELQFAQHLPRGNRPDVDEATTGDRQKGLPIRGKGHIVYFVHFGSSIDDLIKDFSGGNAANLEESRVLRDLGVTYGGQKGSIGRKGQ